MAMIEDDAADSVLEWLCTLDGSDLNFSDEVIAHVISGLSEFAAGQVVAARARREDQWPIAAAALFCQAQRAMERADGPAAASYLERALQLKSTDPRVPLSLIGVAVLSPERIVELIEPVLGFLLENIRDHPLQASWLLTAALKTGRADVLTRCSSHVSAMINDLPLLTGEAFAALNRFQLLQDHGFGDLIALPDDEPLVHLANAARALDEKTMRDNIHLLREDDLPGWREVSALAMICRAQGWDGAYRNIQHLLIKAVRCRPDDGGLDVAWRAAGLPGGVAAFITRRARHESAEALFSARRLFVTNPGIEEAIAFWHELARQGDAAGLLHHAALDSEEIATARMAMSTREKIDETTPPLWIFMTWRENACRLLAHLASFERPAGRTIVSIGGDGRPWDLARATGAMIVPGCFFLNRAPISWGGPRLFFETVLEIMRVFVGAEREGASFQIVCDRTFPLIDLETVAKRAADPDHLKRYRFLEKLVAWQGEMPDKHLADLPEKLDRAISDVYGHLDLTLLMELAGPWNRIADDDYRLRMISFNFNDIPEPVSAGGRLGGIGYFASPFEADAKWMSHARLRSLVDTAPEGGGTFSRSLAPHARRWVWQTIGNLPVRNGDPFNLLRWRAVEAMLQHPQFDAIATAMGQGFGPEMNFFNTMADLTGSSAEVVDLYRRVDVPCPGDNELAVLAAAADVHGHAFFRKTDVESGQTVLRYFSERLRDAKDWKRVHWAAVRAGAVYEADSVVWLDEDLVTRLVDRNFYMQNMLGRSPRKARLGGDGALFVDDALAGVWYFQSNAIHVAFSDPKLGTKIYRSIASDPHRLILAPSELVNQDNNWSIFLVFDFEVVAPRHEVTLCTAAPVAGEPLSWRGAARQNDAVLAALSDYAHHVAQPAFSGSGEILEYREADGRWLALAIISGMPTLLVVDGGASVAGEVLLLTSRADEAEVAAWRRGRACSPKWHLSSEAMMGLWCLETIYDERMLRLCSDGAILEEQTSALVGRWYIAPEGVRLFGLRGLAHGYARQWRVEGGEWRFSGWGEERIGRPVSFALRQVVSC